MEATPRKQQLCGHLPLISKTIQIRRTRHVGHCWSSKDELISGVLLWTPSQGWASVGHIYRHHHHHQNTPTTQTSFTHSCSLSLSIIAFGKSSRRLSVFIYSWWMYVSIGRPALVCPCVGVHEKISLMNSSLLLQQLPACLARLTWIVCEMGGKWPYSHCFVWCCFQDLFKTARCILV